MASASNSAQKASTKTKVSPVTAREIQFLKQKLISDQERILGNFEEKKVLGGQANYTETKDEVDSANEDILLSTTLRFSNRENFYLKKIKKAVQIYGDSKAYTKMVECAMNKDFSWRIGALLYKDLYLDMVRNSNHKEDS